MAPWKNRIVGYANVDTDQLKANPKNWRTHTKRQTEVLSSVVSEVGVVQNIIVNKTTGLVVDGHLRLSLAIRDNQPTVPVTFVELTEAEEALIISTFDPISALAETDTHILSTLLQDIESSDTQIRDLLSTLTQQNQSYALPDPITLNKPLVYDDAQERQPIDKSINLMGDPLSTTYKEPAPAPAPMERESYKEPAPLVDDWQDDVQERHKPKASYTPRAGEEWVVDHTHRIYVTTNPDDAWIDRDWRPILQSKQPLRFFDALHRTISDMQTDASAPIHLVACTDSNCKHYWYQLALRPDVAAMFIAHCDEMKLFTEML